MSSPYQIGDPDLPVRDRFGWLGSLPGAVFGFPGGFRKMWGLFGGRTNCFQMYFSGFGDRPDQPGYDGPQARAVEGPRGLFMIRWESPPTRNPSGNRPVRGRPADRQGADREILSLALLWMLFE